MTAPITNLGDAPAPILLVDDRPANLVALEVVVKAPEHELVCAQSGPEALALVASREFAVVLLDLQMPIMDGAETALEIARIGEARGRTVPIIFLTATDAPIAHILRAYASGAADFMQKPLEPDIVRAKVQVFVGLFRTQQRLLAEIEERRRAQDALAARDRLLAIVSHDLRSPLNAILLGTTQIQRAAGGPQSADVDRPARAIVRAVGRMSRLVEDLLDLATLDAGQPLSMKLGRHDLALLGLEIMELLEPVARSIELTLRAEFVAGLYVHCDPQRVQQVLANLIGNAIKFNRSHGSIDVAAVRKDAEVVVSVRDSGIGIRADEVEHIFDPYWKGDPTRRDGAGLGLSIAREIVEAHGGRIWVDRAEGGGCAFSFTLRAVEAAQRIELQDAP